MLLSDNDIALGRNGIEVLTTQDSCDFPLADTLYRHDLHFIEGHCVQLLVAISHLIKGVNVFIAVSSTPNS